MSGIEIFIDESGDFGPYVDIRDVGDSVSEYSRYKDPANSFALVSGSKSGLHDEPHCTSFVGDRGTCKARKLFLWRREELPAKLAQVHSEERMEIMIARLVCPVRVGVGMAAREMARKGAGGRAEARGGVEGRGGGGFLPGGRRRGGWGRDSGHIAI